MVHVGLHSVGTYHKKFGRENKKNKKVICRVSTNDTRQRMVCRVPAVQHSAKDCKRFFAECHPVGTRQRTLCRVPAIWLSAKNILIFLKKSLPSARSRALGKAYFKNKKKSALPSVYIGHSAKTLFAECQIFDTRQRLTAVSCRRR
jgi:hypothetical protein